MQRVSFQNLCAATLLFFALSFPFTRALSGLNLIVFFCISLPLSLFLVKKIEIPKSLLWLCVLALIYIGLSAFRLLPNIWLRYFEFSAIPQQALFSYALPTTLLLIIFYFRNNIKSKEDRRNLSVKLFYIWLTIKSIDILGALFISQPEDLNLTETISISGMGSISSLIIISTSLYLSTINKPLNRLPIILVFVALSSLSPFSQNIIFALSLAFIWILPRYSVLYIILFITSSIFIYFYAYLDPYALFAIDQNLTVRLVLLKDAISGLIESSLVGVGFGSEAIKNYYLLFDNPIFRDEEDVGFIHLAHHNSFATIAFRLGAAGLLLFLIFTYQTFKRVTMTGPENHLAIKSSAFLAFFIVTFLNPALESFIYLYGVCAYFGIILAFEEKKRKLRYKKITPRKDY